MATKEPTHRSVSQRARQRALTHRQVRRVVELLEAHFGVPAWEGPRDPLDAMVQTILSQSTSDTNSGAAFRSLKERFPSWELAAAADSREIAEAIRRGGLAGQKSVCIKDFLLWVKDRFGSFSIDAICDMQPNEAYEVFCKVRGIGVKTVAVTLLFACGMDVFPVDTHVTRICRRVGLVPEKASSEKIHWLMEPHVPEGKGHSLHVNLLRLGRQICLSRPRCGICPLRRVCRYAKEQRPWQTDTD